jgi:enoyl-CoA hydratase
MIRIESRDRIYTVIIDRPERKNAVDRATADALSAAFTKFNEDQDHDVAVLAGSNGTFCAGADLKAIAEGQANRVDPEGDGPLGPTRMRLDKPVIAAIAGHAVAGGLELALWCDLRVMEEDAILGVFCRRFGVPLIDGGTIRLPRLIGMSRALDLILTGRPVSAAEAQTIGLVHRVAPPGGALEAAQQLAKQLAAFPQSCLRGDRRSAYAQWDLGFEDALRYELDCGLDALAKEGLDGARRFVAGRGRHGSFE